MIVAAAVLVISNDQKCLVPVRAVTQRVIDIMNELFTQRYVVIRVLAVSCRVPARLQKDVGRQRAFGCSRLKIREYAKVGVVGIYRIRKILPSERRFAVAVDRPAHVGLRKRTEDRWASV